MGYNIVAAVVRS